MSAKNSKQANPREVIQTLADFFACLPTAAVAVAKALLKKDWRSNPADVTVREESFESLANNMPTGYKLIYESKDGKMCLYSDREGHLVSADARKFV